MLLVVKVSVPVFFAFGEQTKTSSPQPETTEKGNEVNQEERKEKEEEKEQEKEKEEKDKNKEEKEQGKEKQEGEKPTSLIGVVETDPSVPIFEFKPSSSSEADTAPPFAQPVSLESAVHPTKMVVKESTYTHKNKNTNKAKTKAKTKKNTLATTNNKTSAISERTNNYKI